MRGKKKSEDQRAALAQNQAKAPKQSLQGTMKDDEDMQHLEGLRYLVRRKRQGDTLQEKAKRQRLKQLAKDIQTLQTELHKPEKRYTEAELLALARGYNPMVDDSSMTDDDVLDEGYLEQLLGTDVDSDEEDMAVDDVETPSITDPQTVDKSLLASLQGKKRANSDQLQQYKNILQLIEAQRLEEEEDKKAKKSLLANLKLAKKKIADPKRGRSALNLELLEKSSREALERHNAKKRDKEHRELLGQLLARAQRKGLTQSLENTESTSNEGTTETLYNSHVNDLESLLADLGS